MLGKRLLTLVSAILMATIINKAQADYYAAQYCPLVPSGTRLPSLTSCQKYYICNSDGTVTPANCSSLYSFDKNSQSCRPSSSANCNYDNECANQSNVFVGIVDNCKEWIWCVDGAEVNRGSCPDDQIFHSDTGACIYGSCSSSENVVTSNICKIMQSGQYFGDLTACENWHICRNLELQSGRCNTHNQLLVYNAERRMCLENDNNMCGRIPAGPYTPEEICDSTYVDGLKPDPAVCSTYFECDNVDTWTKLQCPFGQYFDVIESKCLDRLLATPADNCDRCEYSSSQWVNAVDRDECRKYLHCKNSAMWLSGSCPREQYFDEDRQACLSRNDDLLNYRSRNGACMEAYLTKLLLMPTDLPKY